jgi:hypothetical protein
MHPTSQRNSFSLEATQPVVHRDALLSAYVRREQALEAYSSKLREETDLERLGEHLTGVVAETIQPSHLSL